MLFTLVICSSSLAAEPTAETGETIQTVEKNTVFETVEEKAEIKIPEGFTAGFANQAVNPEEGFGIPADHVADCYSPGSVLQNCPF